MADKIAAAKARLVVVEPHASSLSALGAAALAATAAVLMACVMVIGPGVHFEDATSTYQP
ncbi:MAG: peptidoglycan-binding protein [Brevundimonas sp.]|nr:peptidoglycan-binding protein [Brevundimonas sp.]